VRVQSARVLQQLRETERERERAMVAGVAAAAAATTAAMMQPLKRTVSYIVAGGIYSENALSRTNAVCIVHRESACMVEATAMLLSR